MIAQTFTTVLYYLAAYPEHIAPLREEIKNVVSEYGWTKMALGRMRKLDSFMKESVQHEGGIQTGKIGLITIFPSNLHIYSRHDASCAQRL